MSNPCQRIPCTIPDDFRAYGLQGFPPQPLPPTAPPPVPPYGSEQVFYQCGESISFTGTLPGWITVDSANNRLVGAPNTFREETRAEATANAQAAIEAFAAAAMEAGDLTCGSMCDPGAAIAIEDTITCDTGELFGIAYAPNDQRMFATEGLLNAARPARVFVIDVTTNTVEGFVEFPGETQIEGICYGSGQDEIYVIAPDTDTLYTINPTTLAIDFSTVIVQGGVGGLNNCRWLAYDAGRDCVYISDQSPSASVGKFDCATHAQVVASTYIAFGDQSSGICAYCPTTDRIYLGTQFDGIHVVNPVTFALDTTISTPPVFGGVNNGVDFIGYSALADRIFAQHITTSGYHVINPATAMVEYNVNPGAYGMFGMCDNECRELVATQIDETFHYLNLADGSSNATIAMGAGNEAAGCAYCSFNLRVYVCVNGTDIFVIT